MVEPGSVQTQSRSDAATVPAPRVEQPRNIGTTAAQHAHNGLVAARRAADRLDEVVSGLSAATLPAASRLPGWTRGHVLTHLARNADALVNLLGWAKTGVEHPMYPSGADRDADIAEGAHRLLQVQQEDLTASSDRFFGTAEALSDYAWEATLVSRSGRPMPASDVPWMRLTELLVHLVDLDLGLGFTDTVDLAGEQLPGVFDYVAWTYGERSDVPALEVEVELSDGELARWPITTAEPGDEPALVRGPAPAMLSWLCGRDSDGLAGPLPVLPVWM
jgi:maleylpyruvate isomerase